MAKKKNVKYALFKTGYGKAYIVMAEIRFVSNPKHKNYGECSVYTDMQYNPLTDHEKYTRYMSETMAKKILKELGFIKVKNDFSGYNIKDLRQIKSKIPAKWIKLFNIWANYTG